MRIIVTTDTEAFVINVEIYALVLEIFVIVATPRLAMSFPKPTTAVVRAVQKIMTEVSHVLVVRSLTSPSHVTENVMQTTKLASILIISNLNTRALELMSVSQ